MSKESIQAAERECEKAEEAVRYAQSLLTDAADARFRRYQVLCFEKYGLKEGVVVVFEASRRGPLKEALFVRVMSDCLYLSRQPWIKIREKTASGWSKRETTLYSDWKVKDHG